MGTHALQIQSFGFVKAKFPSLSSNPPRKQSHTSVYENAAQIAANGMSSLGASVVEAQQLLVTSQVESKFTQCLKVLNEMKMEGCILSWDYF